MEYMTTEELKKAYEQRVLRDMNECDSACEPLGMGSTQKGGSTTITDWLMENMPMIQYALERKVNYIFSNGLATGNENQDDRLDKWLFSQSNRSGATNYSVLREAVKLADSYGESGLRWFDNNIYAYKQGHFGILLSKESGIEKIEAYYIRKDGGKVPSDIKDENWGNWEDWEAMERYFGRQELLLLDPSEFRTLRNDTSLLHGYPTLLQDRQRIKLLMSIYEEMNYDIKNDGIGRVFFWLNNGWTSDSTNEVSTTTELLNNSPKSRTDRAKKGKDELNELALGIRNAGRNSVGLLPDVLDKEHILQIPRQTKSTEFFGWIDGEGEIIAQLIKVDPTLIGVGEFHGNVSMEKHIDNAMLNDIIPVREKYAIQFSEFIASRLGLDKVYFDKYNLQQVKDENEEREKIALTMSRLSNVLKDYDSDAVRQSIETLNEMLVGDLA